MKNKEIQKAEKLYNKSIKILKKFQLRNGAILASSPKGRYPYVYPRDHAICILGLISARELKRAKKGLEFIFNSQNKNGSFSQRIDKKGKDASYKPIQLDNTGLVLYAFADYIKEANDKEFLKENRQKVNKSLNYLKKQLHKNNLFFTPNSIHEFPPLEEGFEIWANAVCYGALKKLKEIKFSIKKFDLQKIKKSIDKHFWNKDYFIKTIRVKESSSTAFCIDASTCGLFDYEVFDNDNKKIIKNMKKIEKKLWNKDIGGICRYEKFIGRNNGGWGPWPHFTLMVARHHIKLKNRKEADKYIEWVLQISYNFKLPEHIATKKEFEEWVDSSKRAGILRKDRRIMIRNIRKNKIFKKKGLAYSVLPLAWPHAEFIRTWNLYKRTFL